MKVFAFTSNMESSFWLNSTDREPFLHHGVAVSFPQHSLYYTPGAAQQDVPDAAQPDVPDAAQADVPDAAQPDVPDAAQKDVPDAAQPQSQATIQPNDTAPEQLMLPPPPQSVTTPPQLESRRLRRTNAGQNPRYSQDGPSPAT